MIEIENPLVAFSEFPGPILLLAGPGTGKTYQIEKRIEYLVNDLNASPKEIAVITFTVAAARNMRKRLADEKHDLPPEKIPHDRWDNPLLLLNDNAVKIHNVTRFIHVSGNYEVENGKLVRQSSAEFL